MTAIKSIVESEIELEKSIFAAYSLQKKIDPLLLCIEYKKVEEMGERYENALERKLKPYTNNLLKASQLINSISKQEEEIFNYFDGKGWAEVLKDDEERLKRKVYTWRLRSLEKNKDSLIKTSKDAKKSFEKIKKDIWKFERDKEKLNLKKDVVLEYVKDVNKLFSDYKVEGLAEEYIKSFEDVIKVINGEEEALKKYNIKKEERIGGAYKLYYEVLKDNSKRMKEINKCLKKVKKRFGEKKEKIWKKADKIKEDYNFISRKLENYFKNDDAFRKFKKTRRINEVKYFFSKFLKSV